MKRAESCIVQLVFTKTRILTVKVATLVTFLSLVKTLDQVCFASQYFSLDAHISNVDQSHAKTCTPAIKNPHKGACCYGEVHVLITAFVF
jgi:hypothetical protein